MRALEQSAQSPFSLSTSVLRDILQHARPLGHHEQRDTLNLGFGFVYYGLVRALRPRHVLVIGSGFGFSVVCLALGLRDNGRGVVTFVDPSFSMLRHGPAASHTDPSNSATSGRPSVRSTVTLVPRA